MSENQNAAGSPGRAHLLEPVIVSGKCFCIKILSAYDFMLCAEMCSKLENTLAEKGFKETSCKKLCEYACVAAMCFCRKNGAKIFADGLSALKNLTSEELNLIYREYTKLQNKILKKDSIAYNIVESVKKYDFKQSLKNEKIN